MKILMRNIGMTLHVIHKLRERGITNVQVNMDWQHLIMNGESLGEYAAMLAAEGLLGHQHANSGWGTFDDDNMVGATAFMETLELAVELRRAGTARTASGSGSTSTRTPRTRSPPSRGACAVALHLGRLGEIDEQALREAQSRKDAVRAYELVYACASSRRSDRAGRPRRRDDRREGTCAVARRRGRSRAEARLQAPRRAPAGPSRTRGLVGRRAGGAPRGSATAATSPDRLLRPDARPRRARREATGRSARRSSGTTSAPGRSAARSRSGSGSSG